MFKNANPYIIWTGYSGNPWRMTICKDIPECFSFLESLRPSTDRPTDIIIKGFNDGEMQKALEMLYVPKIFRLVDGKLEGGYGPTRKYFARIFKLQDGGCPSWLGINNNGFHVRE